jgi:hypothetical protein
MGPGFLQFLKQIGKQPVRQIGKTVTVNIDRAAELADAGKFGEAAALMREAIGRAERAGQGRKLAESASQAVRARWGAALPKP